MEICITCTYFIFAFIHNVKKYTIQKKMQVFLFNSFPSLILFSTILYIAFLRSTVCAKYFLNFMQHFSLNTYVLSRNITNSASTQKGSFVRRNNRLSVRLHVLLNYTWMFWVLVKLCNSRPARLPHRTHISLCSEQQR